MIYFEFLAKKINNLFLKYCNYYLFIKMRTLFFKFFKNFINLIICVILILSLLNTLLIIFKFIF